MEKLLTINRYNSPIKEIKHGKNSTHVIKAHSHNEITIGFVLSGETVITTEGKDIPLEAGTMMLIPKSTVHLCSPKDRDNFEYYMLHINDQWLAHELGLIDHIFQTEKQLIPKNLILNKPLSDESIRSLFLEYFNLIPAIEIVPKNILSEVKQYIDENYTNEISLDYITEEFNYNKFSLIRSFKKVFNLSPHAYIINKRINRSKILLLDNYSMSEIAIQCGFYDQSHFIKTFKDYTGMTPEQYR